MTLEYGLLLVIGGLVSGVLAGFLGIGGGTMLVPFMTALGISPLHAVATSNLSIVLTSIAGSLQNWRMGHLNMRRVGLLGIPALLTAQAGVEISSRLPASVLLFAFGVMLITNIYLVDLRKQVTQKATNPEAGLESPLPKLNPVVARLITGGLAGLLAGLFGVGGGVIMVPLQLLLLGEKIKVAIQTSLGVIVITATSALIGHAIKGNVLPLEGIILGLGGLVGVQISTRILPKLPDQKVSLFFRSFLALLALYIFWQAYHSLHAA